jgi:hypothetical protein
MVQSLAERVRLRKMNLTEVVDCDDRATRMDERQNVCRDEEPIRCAREHFERQTEMGPETRKWDSADFCIRGVKELTTDTFPRVKTIRV